MIEVHGDLGRDVFEIVGSPNIDVASYFCRSCGWWEIKKEVTLFAKHQIWCIYFLSAGMLRKLDLADVDLPLSIVRKYLIRHYSERFNMHPRKFEEIVGDVFKDFGYYSFVTGYTRDGGIDIVLENSSGEQIGVQVKRNKDFVEVEQIREFVGALVLRGVTKGIFVTTSKFRKGSHTLSNLATQKGVAVELMDATKFFDALKIAQLKSQEVLQFAYLKANLELVGELHLNSL
jgi:restriction system protein